MNSAIFISIKPIHTQKIESGQKNYEFRKYIPKKRISKLYVYESSPSSCLKYILTIDKIVEYPDKIDGQGIGNYEFNNGLKKTKYAYHIASVKKIDNPIKLDELRREYDFCPPQSYAYDIKYPKLAEKLEKLLKECQN